jgi:(p)ppGpp synthase/HD superfamily hydrolase
VNTPLIRFARYYASIKHAPQQYSGGLPYTHHLAAVETVLRRFGFDGSEDLLTAAWLHDVCEDQGVKHKEIAELFTDRVAELVAAVTNEPGANRKERAERTYPKIRSTPGAVTLKLADRIANVEQGGKLVDMYRKEYKAFREALYSPMPYTGLVTSAKTFAEKTEDMWDHLDRLLTR